MTAFTQQADAIHGTLVESEAHSQEPAKRPPRWSLTNWPVRWKVLAIVLVPLLLAGLLGGLRIYSTATAASQLRLAADRAQLVPHINSYMAALEGALVAATVDKDAQDAQVAQDAQDARNTFDESRADLQRQLQATDVIPEVLLAVTTLTDFGEDLMSKVAANSIDLRQRVASFVPLLLTAETAITGSVRSDDENVQLQAEGLARAIGTRGQMAMQQMLVTRGADLAEPDLRTAMTTLAGTEPATIAGIGNLLGGASQQVSTLRAELVKRLSVLSDPAAVLAGNPELMRSQQATTQVAEQVIADTTEAIPAAVERAADTQRTAAIRDALLVLAALVLAAAVVWLVARSLIRPLRTLRDNALKVAHDDLAREIERVRSGAAPGPVQPIPLHTTEEIGQVAHAVDELHEQAVLLAGEQAQLQAQVADMFETLSRRSRSLVDQQLSLIDSLERNEEDPERLDSLFRLDHLAARMRRNGANLLLLAGAQLPREQDGTVPVSTIINAANSEVEDYTRVVTATVSEAEIIGTAAGDLIHILAELVDNALQNSPPATQVRVSAVAAEEGALVIEVSDGGLGMTESDLRVANSRLRSGGEVNPYTARHMGLFVVGQLAAQHGVVVRLRTTVEDDPGSGTTAEVYVPARLLGHTGADVPDQPSGDADTRFAFAHEPDATPDADAHVSGVAPGAPDRDDSSLPQRSPGASGIPPVLGADAGTPAFTDTSAFFASRAVAASNGTAEVAQPAGGQPDADDPAEGQKEPSPTAGEGDAIYQRMLSEWLIDPTEIARSADWNWESVWDHGWSAAEAAESEPVARHTEEGLPIREPGARLVPGAADSTSTSNGSHRNGGVHRSDDQVASAAEPDGDESLSRRDPESVRASISSHFGGVHAGRSHARDAGRTDDE